MLNGKPWQLESALKLLLRLVACFAGGMVALAALRTLLGEQAAHASVLALAVSMTATHGGALVVTWLLLREHAVGWVEAFGLRRQVGWSLTLATASFILAFPVVWYLHAVTLGQLKQWGFDFDPQAAVKLMLDTKELWLRALLGICAILIAPVAEEVFFRGFLYPLVKQHTSRNFAIVITSLFFALIHLNVPSIPPLFALALVLTVLYQWTGNLLASITLHLLFNLGNFVVMLLAERFGDQFRSLVQ